MSNHLLIGLGGTGCAVVREFRKLLFSEWRRNGNGGSAPDVHAFPGPVPWGQQETRIATLSVDSDGNDLCGHPDKWRVPGEQLSLRDNEKVLLDCRGLSHVIANPHGHPGIRPWMEPEQGEGFHHWQGHYPPCGLGGSRRLGRLALALNLPKLLDAISAWRLAFTGNGVDSMTLHLVCSVAGGTGGGILIDILAQARRLLGGGAGQFPIHLHLLVSAGDAGYADTGYFHANQYAALQELNALSVGLYKPWDLGATVTERRLTVDNPFDSASIVTDAAENGQCLSLAGKVHSVASFLFLTMLPPGGPGLPPLAMAQPFPFFTDSPGSVRSTRFTAYGVSRLAIPEEKIHQKLTFSFVAATILRLLHGGGMGLDQESPQPPPGELDAGVFVEQRKAIWGITPDQLNLARDCLAQAGEPYPTHMDNWSCICEKLETGIKALHPLTHVDWIPEFDSALEEYWRMGFRGQGVEDYFSARGGAEALADRARQLVEGVEQDLLHGMENLLPDYGAGHFPGIIRRILTCLQLASHEFSQELRNMDAPVQAALADAERNRVEMDRVGIFARAMGKHLTIFSAYVKSRQRFYYLETLRRADEYALKLIERAVPGFRALEQRAEEFSHRLRAMAKGHLETGARPIVEDGDHEGRSGHDDIPYADEREVTASIRALLADGESRRIHDRAVAERLKALRRPAGKAGFERLIALTPSPPWGGLSGELVEAVHDVSFPLCRGLHDRRLGPDCPFRPILGCNIVEKLHHDHQGRVSGELVARIRRLMHGTSHSAAFDRNSAGRPPVPALLPVFGKTVLLPECGGVDPGFQAGLAQLINEAGKHGFAAAPPQVLDIPEESGRRAVTVISTAHCFPLRLLKTVCQLRQRYSARIQHGGGAVDYHIHAENHCPSLPSLFPE